MWWKEKLISLILVWYFTMELGIILSRVFLTGIIQDFVCIVEPGIMWKRVRLTGIIQAFVCIVELGIM